MGPLSAKTYPGQEYVGIYVGDGPKRLPAVRARYEADYGRRGKGYLFGAFLPASGAAFTAPYPGRTAENWRSFLEQVEAWLPVEAERVYAILDNLSSHRTTDVLLFSLAYPRWEFVFQPTYAPYLNLIEPRVPSGRRRCCARWR